MNFLNFLTRILFFGDFTNVNKKTINKLIPNRNIINNSYYDDRFTFHFMMGIIV